MKPRILFSAEFIADIYRAGGPGASSKSGGISRLPDELPAKTLILATAIFVLGKTVPAIHRAIFSWFERNFAFLFTIGADSLMHLSGTSIVSSILKSHIISPVFADFYC
jgi:hypothetical protein